MIDQLYGSEDLVARILDALSEAGRDLEALTRADLSGFDEFHAGGIDATRDMAAFATLGRGSRVLDLGSGIGGPARTLAAEWDCVVTGVDITASYCDVARELSRRLGMSGRVEFLCVDAVDLPMPDASFDIVWSQYSLLNIEDQPELFSEVVRVLKPGGSFVFETQCQGPKGDIYLPVFWAEVATTNHIRTPAQMEHNLTAAGFLEIAFEDRTAAVLTAARRRLQAAEADEATNKLWLGLIVPKDATTKMQNSILNNEEGRALVMRGLFRKPA